MLATRRDGRIMPHERRDQGAINRQFQAVDAAYKAGDMAALQHALGDPPGFPNVRQPHDLGLDVPLEYAIYHSPLAFISELIALGADVDYEDAGGFPALIAAISTERSDKLEILRLLLDAGAGINRQRGINDWTPLHYAFALRDLDSIRLLLARAADPTIATRIDDRTSPLEDAEAAGLDDVVAMMRAAIARGDSERGAP